MSPTGEPAAPGPGQPRIRPYLQVPKPPAAAPPLTESGPGSSPGSGPDSPTSAARPRPFVLTSGRVSGSDPDIALETQVTRRLPPPGAAPVASLAPELQAILALCAVPISVAEISARVPLHLGVTKVLVGDLRAAGHLDVHVVDEADTHDPDIILRVIRGLRAIS